MVIVTGLVIEVILYSWNFSRRKVVSYGMSVWLEWKGEGEGMYMYVHHLDLSSLACFKNETFLEK